MIKNIPILPGDRCYYCKKTDVSSDNLCDPDKWKIQYYYDDEGEVEDQVTISPMHHESENFHTLMLTTPVKLALPKLPEYRPIRLSGNTYRIKRCDPPTRKTE